MEILKSCLDGILCNLLQVTLVEQGGGTRSPAVVPSSLTMLCLCLWGRIDPRFRQAGAVNVAPGQGSGKASTLSRTRLSLPAEGEQPRNEGLKFLQHSNLKLKLF